MSLSPEEQRLFEEVLKSGGRVPLPLGVPSNPSKEDNCVTKVPDSYAVGPSKSPISIRGDAPINGLSNTSSLFHGAEKKYTTLEETFPNAAAFLMFFDASLRNGSKQLYKWQVEELLRLSERGKWKTNNKLMYYLLANNGSGKDAFIIAGFVCYVLCCWRRYKIVITSASDNQLNTQTRVYIKDLAESVNAYMKKNWGVEAIEIKAETFRAVEGFTGTEVFTFVSKEGGVVEGYHPFPDADPDEGVIIIVNEGKTIPAEIHRHLKKCTYSHWIEVSSAGEAAGDFFNAYSKATFYPDQPQAFRPFFRVVDYRDTPHKFREAQEAIEEFGIEDAFIKNTYLSKFSSYGEQVAITEEALDKCLNECHSKIVIGKGKHAGLDLAAGGDECAFYVFDDNVFLGYESWRVKDTEATVDLLVGDAEHGGLFQKWGITSPEQVTGDDNGLGEAILNSLARRKINPRDPKNTRTWSINRVKNQQSARRKDRFLNRGAEMYSTMGTLITKCLINWNGKMHPKLKQQLTTRHYVNQGAKYKLIDKKDEAVSPDHADAAVLAFNGITIHDFTDKEVKSLPGPRGHTPAPILSTNELIKATFERNMKWQLEGAKKPQDQHKGFTRFRNPISILRTQYDN